LKIYVNRQAYLVNSTLVTDHIWAVFLAKYTDFVCIGGLLNLVSILS
jgi:hypothetical protein